MDIVYFFLILGVLLSIMIPAISLAPWVPTKKKDVLRLIEILELPRGSTFLEIGSGDGRVSFRVAQTFSGAEIHGIEYSFPVFLISKIFQLFRKKSPNLSLRFGNAFHEDFGKYDVIYIFGMPDKMAQKVVPKFLTEAKTGAKLYSYTFSLPKDYRDKITSYGEEGELKIHVLEK